MLQIIVNASTIVKELEIFQKKKTKSFMSQYLKGNSASSLCLSILLDFYKLPASSQFDIQTLFDILWLSLAL